jgi:hypothetical protein
LKNIRFKYYGGKKVINKFFDAAYEAVKKEEKELNDLFALNKEYYKNNHHGVCNLYETTFVYLIFKELMREEYPFTVYWEYPYNTNKKLHCDLALLNKDGTLDSLIEFKIWARDDDSEIKNDIKKLQNEIGCKKYIFIIGYGGDIEENHKYLCENNSSLRCIDQKQLKTKFFKTNLGRVEDNNLNLFMYEVI